MQEYLNSWVHGEVIKTCRDIIPRARTCIKNKMVREALLIRTWLVWEIVQTSDRRQPMMTRDNLKQRTASHKRGFMIEKNLSPLLADTMLNNFKPIFY